MKYLAVIDEFFPDQPGGAARVAWDIALAVRDAGNSVTLFCKSSDNSEKFRVRHVEGVRVILASPKTASRHTITPYERAVEFATSQFEAALGAESWDLVHLHTPLLGTAVAAVVDARTPLVYTMHSPASLEIEAQCRAGLFGWLKAAIAAPQLRRIEQRLVAKCRLVHCLSNYTRIQCGRLHGENLPFFVSPHWISEGFRREHSSREAKQKLGWPVDTPAVLTVRALVPRNGVHVAIAAMAPLVSRGRCSFKIAGAGPLRDELERYAEKQGFVAPMVQFLGRLDEGQLKLAYEAADLFVLPTLELECFGLIIGEAFAFGCPVVASDTGAIPELLHPITPGMLVPAGDVKALTAKVSAFLDGSLVVPSTDFLVQYAQDRFSAYTCSAAILNRFSATAITDAEPKPSALFQMDT